MYRAQCRTHTPTGDQKKKNFLSLVRRLCVVCHVCAFVEPSRDDDR